MLPGTMLPTPQQGMGIIRDYRLKLDELPTRPSYALACGSGWRPAVVAAANDVVAVVRIAPAVVIAAVTVSVDVVVFVVSDCVS